jgi:hypothetical protein
MTNKPEEKTAGQKLRERFWNIKKSIKPSKELTETMEEYARQYDEQLEKDKKKVARPYSPEAGA